jgi:hypothetical protein
MKQQTAKQILEKLRQRQSYGGKKRWKGMTKKDRAKEMSRVAKERWSKQGVDKPIATTIDA